jgi:hypothetical protein
MKARISLLLLASLTVLTARAWAEAPTSPGPKGILQESLGFSVNQLGLQNVLDLAWVWPLITSRNPLLAAAHASAGVTSSITPSYTRLGAWVELAPLSILDLRAGAEPGAYFGTFGSLLSFSSYAAPFDDATRSARQGEARAGSGSRLYLSPTLKMKVGPFAASTNPAIEWWRSSAPGPFYYEPARDTLLKVGGDRLLTLASVFLRQHDLGGRGGLSYGFGHYLTYVFDAPANESQRIGVIVVRQFGARRFGLHAPRIGSQVSYYLRDPSRKGQVSAGLGLTLGLGR